MTESLDFEFESAYRGASIQLGVGIQPQWSIGGPQPELPTLLEQRKFHGEVLDVGCVKPRSRCIGPSTVTPQSDISPTRIDLARREAAF
jgi:hypothetical protein